MGRRRSRMSEIGRRMSRMSEMGSKSSRMISRVRSIMMREMTGGMRSRAELLHRAMTRTSILGFEHYLI